jgi:hypothetical protein
MTTTEADALAERIDRFVRERGHVTFVELERTFPEIKGDLAITFRYENVILWNGVNALFNDAVNELIAAKRVFMWPAVGSICYIIDGKVLTLPEARSIRPYKQPHWLKVTLHYRPIPAATSRRTARRPLHPV